MEAGVLPQGGNVEVDTVSSSESGESGGQGSLGFIPLAQQRLGLGHLGT